MKTVHFIRHGETEQNALKVWQGHTDTPLNSKGLEQAKLLSERISGRIEKVFSSDLKRASQTASFLSSSPVLRDNLREINVGEFTGMSVKDTYTSNQEIFQSLQSDSFQFLSENISFRKAMTSSRSARTTDQTTATDSSWPACQPAR